MADDLSIFGSLPGDADEDRIRQARRRLRMRNNFVEEGPLPPRARPSGVGGHKPGPPPTPPPPVSVNTVAPAITGTPAVGSTLTCSTGTWTNSPTSYFYAWLVGGVNQGSASTYVIQAGDVGLTIVCRVTARNAGGYSVPASSNTVGPVTAAVSTWSAADASANAMTLSNGGMTVTAGPSGYQSIRGTIGHASGKYYVEFKTSVSVTGNMLWGMASSSFVISNYLGTSNYSIGCCINGVGTFTSPSSDFTLDKTVVTVPAANDVWAIAVDLSAGNIWIAQNNVWLSGGNPATGSPPMVASFIPPSLGQNYFPALSLQAGSTTGVWTLQATAASQTYASPSGFTAWDTGGGAAPSVPVITANPVITGAAQAGQTLSCSTGTWTNSPTSYAYDWRVGGVSKGTGSTYAVLSGDVGSTVVCLVTATNSAGASSPASSNTVGPVIAASSVPVISANPVVTGTTQVGQTLSCSTGTWTGSPTSYSYVWLVGGVSKGTGSTYAILSGDIGSTVICQVTATNAVGASSPASSNTVGPVTAAPSGSTWNTSDAAASGFTLTNGGLTLNGPPVTGPSHAASVRGTVSHTTGKWYVEFLANPTGAGNEAQGVADATFSPTGDIGSSGHSGGASWNTIHASSGFTANFSNGGLVYPYSGDVVGLAVDFTAGSVWMSVRGIWTNNGDPGTGTLPTLSFVPATVGALFPALSPFDRGSAWTLQATAASQTYLPPGGGFQAWDGGPVTPINSTWSTTDATANGMTLSNANLTVAPHSTATYRSIRSTISKTSGKFYIEFALSTASNGDVLFGLANATFASSGRLGSATYSGGIDNPGFVSTGFTKNYDISVTPAVNGEVWALAVDFSAGNVWIAKNNVWLNSSNPATGTAPAMSFVLATVGALFPALSIYPGAGTWTLRPTAASQTYTPPSGFTPWG